MASLVSWKNEVQFERSVSYSGYGRYALLNILKLLKIGTGDRILLPAYICDVVLLSFVELGIEPQFYAVSDDFQVEWDSVRVLPGTRAIITVNYFGFSSDLARIKAFSEQYELSWINDNAHGFASCHGDTPLERFGDVSFTSFRKVIPSLNGVRVSFNSHKFASLQTGFDLLCGECVQEPQMRYVAGMFLRSLGITLRRLPDFSDICAFQDNDMRRFRIDPGATKLLSTCDEAQIRTKRRELFLAIEAFLADNPQTSVVTIPNLLKVGNSPLVFPLVATSRDAWLSVLKKSRMTGIDIHTWPSLPGTVVEKNCCNAVDQWKRFLFLPLHQHVDVVHYLSVLNGVLNAV